jgi:hypothetical protein
MVFDDQRGDSPRETNVAGWHKTKEWKNPQWIPASNQREPARTASRQQHGGRQPRDNGTTLQGNRISDLSQ